MWGSEVDQWDRTERRTQLSTDTRPPSLATVQLNLVKIFPYPMPSRETGGLLQALMQTQFFCVPSAINFTSIGVRPFTLVSVCLWLVWVCLSALYTSLALILSQLTGCYPRSPEQVAGTARRNPAQICRHTHMRTYPRSRVCLAKHGRHPRGLQQVWTGQWWDQF